MYGTQYFKGKVCETLPLFYRLVQDDFLDEAATEVG